jgi:hypothetical protein
MADVSQTNRKISLPLFLTAMAIVALAVTRLINTPSAGQWIADAFVVWVVPALLAFELRRRASETARYVAPAIIFLISVLAIFQGTGTFMIVPR